MNPTKEEERMGGRERGTEVKDNVKRNLFNKTCKIKKNKKIPIKATLTIKNVFHSFATNPLDFPLNFIRRSCFNIFEIRTYFKIQISFYLSKLSNFSRASLSVRKRVRREVRREGKKKNIKKK